MEIFFNSPTYPLFPHPDKLHPDVLPHALPIRNPPSLISLRPAKSHAGACTAHRCHWSPGAERPQLVVGNMKLRREWYHIFKWFRLNTKKVGGVSSRYWLTTRGLGMWTGDFGSPTRAATGQWSFIWFWFYTMNVGDLKGWTWDFIDIDSPLEPAVAR